MLSNIVIFPIKSYSERVQGKNFLRLPDGRKLYQTTTLEALKSGCFNRVVIDTDSDEIKEWAAANRIEFIHRKPELATNTANGNSLIRHHIERFPGFDFYWQGFVTVPGISSETIKKMVRTLNHYTNGLCNGLITVRPCKGFFWFGGQPVSFRPDVLPRSQDLEVTYQERSGFFGISKEGFAETRCRYGSKPYFFEIPADEDIEIDWPSDVVDLQNKKPS